VKKYKYKKNYRTRKKKSIIKNRFFWLFFLITASSGGIIYFLIFSSVFQIEKIQVFGTKKISSEEIIKIISVAQKNIFLVNLNEITKNILEKYPQIVKINLKRKLPDGLVIQVEERTAVAIFCQSITEEENCYFIDKEGVIFEKVSQMSLEMPKIIGESIIGKGEIEQILKINFKLKNDLKILIEKFFLASEEKLTIKTLEGWEIYFNPKENLDWQLTELSIILKERIPSEKRRNLEYIDLRFEKIFIFPETHR